MRGQDWSS